MSKINFYDDVKIIKKPAKKRVMPYLIFFGVSLFMVGIVYVSIFFSNALTVGNIGATIVFGDKNISIAKSTMYAVTLYKDKSKSQAEKISQTAIVQGASGYVWEQDGEYWVIGNIYKNLSDAESVKKQLKDNKYTVEILNIDYLKLSLNFNIENKYVSQIESAILFLDEVYENLYSYSVSLDKKETTNLAISSKLGELRGKVKVKISEIQRLIDMDTRLFALQEALIAVDSLLDDTMIKVIDNSTASYSLKYSISRVARLKFDLYNKLNK